MAPLLISNLALNEVELPWLRVRYGSRPPMKNIPASSVCGGHPITLTSLAKIEFQSEKTINFTHQWLCTSTIFIVFRFWINWSHSNSSSLILKSWIWCCASRILLRTFRVRLRSFARRFSCLIISLLLSFMCSPWVSIASIEIETPASTIAQRFISL
jgi:hypothetical protein